MRRIKAVLLITALVVGVSASLAWAECFILEGGSYFGEEMTLNINWTSQPDNLSMDQPIPLNGWGVDARSNTALFIGTYQSSVHMQEYSLSGSGRITSEGEGIVSAFYQYHFILAPGSWTYDGMIYTSDGSQRTVSGSVVSCD
ncbi:MAG: hypothetical protein JRC92_01320 [Deltaproteobacteria bacterium]|nr:hypothetical protein [Deltaproteobacteria bacterium]